MANLADSGQGSFVELLGSVVIFARTRALAQIAQHGRAVASVTQFFVNGQPLLEEPVGFEKMTQLKIADAEQFEAGRKAGTIAQVAAELSRRFSESQNSVGIDLGNRSGLATS